MGALDRARRARSSSSRCATRRWPPSWPAATPSSPARSGVCLATSGPGRDPPAQRPLRRQARPPAGGGDRRPAGARRARRRLPAGGRPRSPCSRTWRASTCTWRPCPAQVRHLVDRALRIAIGRAHGHLHHRPQRRAGAGRGRDAAARARHGPLRRRLRASRAWCPTTRDLRARRRGAQRRRTRRDPRRRRRAARRPTR